MRKHRHFIFLPNGGCARLAKEFKVSHQTVYNSLNFITDSELARSIRRRAIKRGGCERFESSTNQTA